MLRGVMPSASKPAAPSATTLSLRSSSTWSDVSTGAIPTTAVTAASLPTSAGDRPRQRRKDARSCRSRSSTNAISSRKVNTPGPPSS
jgi:hypothetical protein